MKNNATIPEYDYKSLYPYTKTLSSSQVLLYEEDPSAFYTEYVLGVRRPESVAMLQGSIFSELHRDRNFDFRTALADAGAPKRIGDLFENVIGKFPVVPAEVEMICEHNGWKFRATLDGYVHEEHTNIENKTGGATRMHPEGWTQERVNFSDQITFQAWCKWKRDGITFKTILLNWVDIRPRAPRPLTTFKTSRRVPALKNFERRVEAVVAGIEAENWTEPIYG